MKTGRQTTLRKVKWCKINGIEVLEEREWAEIGRAHV